MEIFIHIYLPRYLLGEPPPKKKKKKITMSEKKKKKKKAIGEFVIFPIPGSFNYLVRSFTGRFNAKMNSACL